LAGGATTRGLECNATAAAFSAAAETTGVGEDVGGTGVGGGAREGCPPCACATIRTSAAAGELLEIALADGPHTSRTAAIQHHLPRRNGRRRFTAGAPLLTEELHGEETIGDTFSL
jgi:hypothetical protein